LKLEEIRQHCQTDERWRTAAHEAAHVIAGYLQHGSAFESVRVRDEYAVINGERRRVAGQIIPSCGRERRDVQAVIALVGFCWEELIYPREDARFGQASSDYECAVFLAQGTPDPSVAMDEWTALAHWSCLHNLDKIASLASVLYRAGEMTFAECVAHIS
jgi:hypothetical protein